MNSTTNHIKNQFIIIIYRLPWKPILLLLGMGILTIWLYFTPEGLLGKADAMGYAVCHRIDARSFHLGNRQIPVCARCTGQYIGAMLGLIYLFVFRPRRVGRPNWTVIGILIAFAVAFAVDGFNSYMHLIPDLSRFWIYQPNNILRLTTGTGLGLGISIMLYPAFNQTVWRRRDPRPVLDGVKDFGGLLVLGILLDLFVLTENPLILYPLALVSAAGILVLLTLVYTMVVLMMTKLENKIEKFSQLIFPVLAGFMVALVQIGVLDYLRFLLTNTWEGFHFG